MSSSPKILFTIGVIDNGGVSKSLLTLLSVIDKEQYVVSLLIAGHDCGRNKDIPKGIKVIEDNVMADTVSGIRGLNGLLRGGHLLIFLGSVVRLILSKFNKGWAGWWLSRLMPVVTQEKYDLIVDYNGQHMLYYMMDKLNGKKKVTFFHSDYKKWRYYESMDRRYFKKVDKIFTISDSCVNSLKEIFPEIAEKVMLMENISSPTYIQQQANEPIAWYRNHKHVLLTLGHVCKNKGSDLAMLVAKRLKDVEIDYEWLFLGTVSNDLDYRGIVRKEGLTENVSFLGNVKNPYPYIRQADVFVHLSRYEGRSIALDEAKILCKPIVVTNFSSVGDQFADGLNASICNMDVDDATEKIVTLIKNDSLRQRYSDNLRKELRDNSSEVNKIYQLL